MQTEGKYVVIEGHDGTGKSTQVALLREKLREQGIESVEMHEPGGVPIADQLRTIVKNGTLERDALTNLLLFTAARREIWQQLAEPALEEGKWVIAARNWYSTLAYQGYGEGLALSRITEVTREFTSEHYLKPDHAFILTLNSNTAERHRRISARGEVETPDHFESRSEAFQQAVNEAYKKIAKTYNILTIDAEQNREAICQELWRSISFSTE